MIRKCALNYFTIILTALLLGSCSAKKDNKAEQVHLKVLNYGRSSTKLLWTEKSAAMPSGEKGLPILN